MSVAGPERSPDAYRLRLPAAPRPIVVLGAGGIVRDAHLPAYAKHGLPVAAIADVVRPRAEALAAEHGIPAVHGSVAEAVAAAPADAVYDLALMPETFESVLPALPAGSAVLIQKPLGHDLAAARRLVAICRERGLVAAVNMQLRFAPYVVAMRDLVASGRLGELVDAEVHVTVATPWERFPATRGLDRLELNMHSVHHIDLVRSFLGDPTDVMCTTLRHPERPYANCRSTILLRYADRPVRVVIATNHEHDFGPEHEQAFVKLEGTDGAVVARMGALMDYPRGAADGAEWTTHDEPGWRPLPFEGSWFPDAFAASMASLQRFAAGETAVLPTSVDDMLRTMALVDAAHRSQDAGGVRPDLAGAA